MSLNRGFWATVLMLAAFVFFALLALEEGGVWTDGPGWFLGGGLSSMVLSFLLGGSWSSWNSGRPVV